MDSTFAIIALLTIIAFFIGDMYGKFRTIKDISAILQVIGNQQIEMQKTQTGLTKEQIEQEAEEEFERFKRFIKEKARHQGITVEDNDFDAKGK